MGIPDDNNLNPQMGGVNPVPVPTPSPAQVPDPVLVQPVSTIDPVQVPDVQALSANIPSLAHHIETPVVDPVAAPVIDPIATVSPPTSVNNVQDSAPVVANNSLPNDLGMSPVQGTIASNNVPSDISQPINPATPVVSDPVASVDNLIDQPFVGGVQPIVTDQVVSTAPAPVTPEIGTQVIGNDASKVPSSDTLSQPEAVATQVEPINIEPPSIVSDPVVTGLNNDIVTPISPMTPTGTPIIEPQNEVIPVQDKVSTINVSPNNIPIEELPTAQSIINQPVTNEISQPPVVANNAQPTVNTVGLVDEIVDEISVTPINVDPVTESSVQHNDGVVNYNNVNAGLNAVVHDTQALDASGTTLSDLVQKSKSQAGVYDTTQPVSYIVQPKVSVEPPVMQDENINSNSTVANTEVLVEQPAIQLNNINQVQNVTPVVENSAPPPVITNDTSMVPSILPPLATNMNVPKKKKGKSTLMMVGLIIVFLMIGMLLLVAGLELSNSVDLPFDVPFISDFFNTL